MRLYIPLLILFFFSCQNQGPVKTVRETNTDTVLRSTSVVAIKSDEKHPAAEDFSNFWKRFRTAVINSDTSQIVAMTHFPFKARGPLDYDPTVKYNKEKFIPVFGAFLNQWNGQDLEGTTELDDIKKTEIPDKAYLQKDNARVGDLVFDSTNKGWRLVFAYLNNETIDSLQK